MNKTLKLLVFLALFAGLNAKDIISVSIDPMAYIVEQITKDSTEINVVIPPNADEHHLDIKPATMKKLENSIIYFTIGLEFEESLVEKLKSNYKDLAIFDIGKDIKKIKLGHDLDPHIWLNPIIAKDLGEKISMTLGKKYPHRLKTYNKNLELFKEKMDKLDANIKQSLKELKNPIFLSFHPSWGYFAKRYGLRQIAVEKHGKEPKLKDLMELTAFIKKHKINTIFIQDGFDIESLSIIQKECDLKVVKLNHLDRDYENMLILAAKKIANAGK